MVLICPDNSLCSFEDMKRFQFYGTDMQNIVHNRTFMKNTETKLLLSVDYVESGSA